MASPALTIFWVSWIGQWLCEIQFSYSWGICDRNLFGLRDEIFDPSIISDSWFMELLWWGIGSLCCSKFEYFSPGFCSSLVDRNWRPYKKYCGGTSRIMPPCDRVLLTVTTTIETCVYRDRHLAGSGGRRVWSGRTFRQASLIVRYDPCCRASPSVNF